MDILEFKNYFLYKKKTSIPELQKELSISYTEIHTFINRFLQLGLIKAADDLYYELDEHRLDTPRIYVFLLYQYIKNQKMMTDFELKQLNLTQPELTKIHAWMLGQNYIKKFNPFHLETIDLKEFMLRFSEYLPFPEEKTVQMNPFKEQARSNLWDYIEANPNVSYLDFKRHCLAKAMETNKTNPSLSSEFLSFLKDYGIHSEVSFHLCKKQGRH